MSTIGEVAERLGVSVEYLEAQPTWIQEGRAPTEDEFTEWSRSQKGGCYEYVAATPISHYQGLCAFYLLSRRHCGVPFVSGLTCKTGLPREGKVVHMTWKRFRRNFDEWARRGGRLWFIKYTCEECGNEFESRRARTGRKICAECIGRLRAQGLGPVQMLKRGG